MSYTLPGGVCEVHGWPPEQMPWRIEWGCPVCDNGSARARKLEDAFQIASDFAPPRRPVLTSRPWHRRS